MLSCKDVTRLLSESMDHSLPLGKRVGVRLHLLICRFCARYERQLLLIRETVRRLAAMEDAYGSLIGEPLSEEAKERIRKSSQLRNPFRTSIVRILPASRPIGKMDDGQDREDGPRGRTGIQGNSRASYRRGGTQDAIRDHTKGFSSDDGSGGRCRRGRDASRVPRRPAHDSDNFTVPAEAADGSAPARSGCIPSKRGTTS